jgi:hypothetical protein
MTAPDPAAKLNWLQRLLKPLIDGAVRAAVDEIHTDLKGDIAGLEGSMFAEIQKLPLLRDIEGIAGMGNLPTIASLQGNLADGLASLANAFNPEAIAKAIAGEIHLPFLGAQPDHPGARADLDRRADRTKLEMIHALISDIDGPYDGARMLADSIQAILDNVT